MPDREILVVTGPDPDLTVDLASFRAVREQTGLGFKRLTNPTWQEFVNHLRRLRLQEYAPMPYLHMAFHSSGEGVQFVDRLASPLELSEVLPGVPLLLLAGCRSTAIADSLAVIPAVVTLLEEISHPNARDLSLVFWRGIGEGLDARTAYERAMQRLPDVAEYTYLATPFLSRT